MAETTTASSNVASIAIVAIVLIAAIAIYMFVIRDTGQHMPDGPSVELNIEAGKG